MGYRVTRARLVRRCLRLLAAVVEVDLLLLLLRPLGMGVRLAVPLVHRLLLQNIRPPAGVHPHRRQQGWHWQTGEQRPKPTWLLDAAAQQVGTLQPEEYWRKVVGVAAAEPKVLGDLPMPARWVAWPIDQQMVDMFAPLPAAELPLGTAWH